MVELMVVDFRWWSNIDALRYSFCYMFTVKAFNFSSVFLRQLCRDIASCIDRHLTEQKFFGLLIQGNRSSSFAAILFIEFFKPSLHILFSLLVNIIIFCY